jgi:hypothetical protein
VSLCTPSSASEIAEIIRNVRANEELYEDIEIRHRVNYGLAEQFREPANSTPVGPHGLTYLSSYVTISQTVQQGGMHFLDHRTEQRLPAGKVEHINSIQAYDGEKTRIREQDKVGNVHEDKFIDARVFQPHLMLVEEAWAFPFNRLSDFLTAKKYGSDLMRWKVLGEESVNALRCWKLACELAGSNADFEKQRPYGRNVIWLAQDRNYLMVKVASYRSWRAGIESEPCTLGEVTSLKELSPGLWFPMTAKEVTYEPRLLYEDKRKVIETAIEWTVDKVRLRPNYDINFFRSVKMPPGGIVYKVKGGKVYGSYIEPQDLRKRGWHWGWVVFANVIALGVLAAVVLLLRGRRR